MVKILHITPHFGGGVGRVLCGYLSKTINIYNHKVISLDYINDDAKKNLDCLNLDYHELYAKKHNFILREIKSYDIILIHWWNHPLLYEFILKNRLPKSRLAFWSHVSGFELPQVFTHKLFNFSDIFVFSSPISYLTKEVISYKKKEKLSTVWSTGGLEHIQGIQKVKDKNFYIGYIGTISSSKMRSNYISLCEKIKIPNVKFIICGEGEDLERLKEEVKQKNLQSKFIFTGFVNDIKPFLAKFDLFGYPLKKNHYGTCDQVIAEAMACGIPPIAFNNKMEEHMIHNLYTGIVVSTEEEYIKAIETLYYNNKLRSILSKNAKKEAYKRFSINNTINSWDKIFKKLLLKEKEIHIWEKNFIKEELKPYQIFLESIGEYSQVFKSNNNKINQFINSSEMGKSKTKGSITHYANFFKEDKTLKKWSQL